MCYEDTEIFKCVPIVIYYLNLVNVKYFCIKYNYYTGKYKFYHQFREELVSPSFIDIPDTAYIDPTINKAQEIFSKQIFLNINTIYKETECINKTNFYVKKFTILGIPSIISLNVNVNDYDDLIIHLDYMNKFFKFNKDIYNNKYKLKYL